MAESFADILDRAPSDIERPKPLPTGTYHCIVVGLPEMGKSAKKQTPYAKFTLRPTAAGDDVDTGELEAMGGLGNKTIPATYYLTEDSLFRLKDFLEHCGITEGSTLAEMIDQSPNREVMAFIRHVPSQDGQSVYAELGRTAPVE